MLRVAASICVALTLSACATPYVGKPYERASSEVHAVGLIGDITPKRVVAVEVASVGQNFGLIGALVDAGIQSSRTDAVNESLDRGGFHAEGKLQERIISSLAAEGYTVKPLQTGVRTQRDFAKTYPSPPEAVDAYLDVVVVSFGYMAAGAGSPFRPTLTAKVRLVSAKDPSKVLMENVIAYNGMGANPGVIALTPNPAYAFKDRDDLLVNRTRLQAGIEDALTQVADTVAALMR
jgi:hypothetical protein